MKTVTELIIAGDYNIDLLKVNEKDVIREFFDILTSHSLYPKITLPTRFSNQNETLINNFFCILSSSTLNSISGILLKKFSDHQPYFICLNPILHREPPPKYIKVAKHRLDAYENMLSDLIRQDIPNKLNKDPNANPSANLDILCNIFDKLKSKYFPVVVKKNNKHKYKKCKWITLGIICSLKYRDVYKQLLIISHESQDYLSIKNKLHDYNTILKKIIRHAKQIYYASRLNACKTDSRKTWSTLNEILNKSQNTRTFPDYFTADANQASDQFIIVNKFNEYFTNIGPELANQINKSGNKNVKDYLNTKHDSVFTISHTK